MSAKIMGQVWDLQLPHAEIFVLLAMADHAEHDGSHVFPSQALIAWKTGYSVRQVRRIQDRLKGRKILISTGSGWRGTNHYRIDLMMAPRKPEWISADKMSSEDKMSSHIKPHVNKSLRTREDKMSSVEEVSEDKMSADKMSSEDICDTRADIAMSDEPSVEPSVKEKDKPPENAEAFSAPAADTKQSHRRKTTRDNTVPEWSEDLPWPHPLSLIALYHALKPDDWAAIEIVTEARLKKCREYLAQFSTREFWERVFHKLHEPSWLRDNLSPQNRTLDWLLQKGHKDGIENCVKVAEGNYAKSHARASPRNRNEVDPQTQQWLERQAARKQTGSAGP